MSSNQTPDGGGALRASETRYRRLFESAQDGILILDADSGIVVDVNPFLLNLLGYTREAFLTKKVWELGFLKETIANEEMFRKLQTKGYVRYEDLPLETSDGRRIDVEFVSNVYQVNEHRVIQCNIRDISERKRAEEALVQTSKLLKDAQAIANLGSWEWDIGHDTWRFSEQWKNIHGISEKSFDTSKLMEIAHPEDAPYIEKAFSDAKDGGKTYDIEHRIIRADDKQIRHIKALGKVEYDLDTGRPVRMVGTAQDITERKQAEEVLEHQRKTYEQILEHSLAGYWDWDIPTGDEYLSPIFKKMFGYEDHEIENRAESWQKLIFAEDLPGVYEKFNQHIESKGGIPFYNEVRYHHKNGSTVWVICTGKVIEWNDDGTAIRMVGCHIDITERKRAETYREMRQEILQILNEPGNFHDSIQRVLAVLKSGTGVDAVGLRLQEGEDFAYLAQDGFSKDFLLTENTLVARGKEGGVCRDKDGKVCLECTCGLVVSGQTDPANPLFTKGGSFWTNDSFPLLDLPADQDLRLHPRNNCIHQGYASVALIPVRTTDQIVGLIQLNDKRKGRFNLETIEILEGIAAHIGSALMRKQAEEERERLQSKLTQAQKMESIGRLAGGVAHDFNNQLMGIMGFADVCRDEIAEDHPIREWLDEITLGAKRSADLTRQLLAFARKQTIAPEVLDLNDAVAGSLKMLERLMCEDIDLLWKPSAELWHVKMDTGQIDQILTNLCVNARDAIGGVGKVTLITQNVTIDADYCKEHAEASIGPHVMLAVSDDGCGMDKETLAHIFEPFYTTKGAGEGTGMGLSTVYGIVKQNNGFIYVYSEPGKGTTLRIYLPRAVTTRPGSTAAVTATTRVGGTETILLVEDEKSVLVTSVRFLEKLGYNVLAADCPDKALRMAAEHEGAIELLITDVVMPGMSGRELVEKLATDYPSMKILYMSGYTADIVSKRGIIEDGVQFISKPFTRDDFAQRVREVLKMD